MMKSLNFKETTQVVGGGRCDRLQRRYDKMIAKGRWRAAGRIGGKQVHAGCLD